MRQNTKTVVYYSSKNSLIRVFNDKVKEDNIMLNNKSYIVIAAVGLATQIFAYLCVGQLKAQTIATFNAFGSFAMFVAFIGYAFTTMYELETLKKNLDYFTDDTRRDFDNVYRHVDECNRELLNDLNGVSVKRKR